MPLHQKHIRTARGSSSGPSAGGNGSSRYPHRRTPVYHTALLVNLSSALNDYPCPDPSFQPAPGQSLEDFLAEGARHVEDGLRSLTLVVDGVSIPDPFGYRVITPLFQFQGDLSLRRSVDGCITRSPQPAVADGFFVMLKPLAPGAHTVVFTAASANVATS